eukprot:c16343_g1_i1.p1 GENE.c16343_g1_i1~~c16343_g1_i1.p1  ORF type:complete len:423 (-),score=162.44 c16343_g1_i1:82-1320(-)
MTDRVSLLENNQDLTQQSHHFEGQNVQESSNESSKIKQVDSQESLGRSPSNSFSSEKKGISAYGSSNQLGSKENLRRQTITRVCENVDISVQNAIAHLMLKAVAELIVRLKISVTNRQNIEPIREEIELAVLQVNHEIGKDIIAEVENELNKYIQKKKRNVVAIFSSLTNYSIEGDIQKQLKFLEDSSIWPSRFNSAKEAICKIDTEGRDHCLMSIVGHQLLAEHQKKECPFRTVNCPNKGCINMFSARMTEEHIKNCDYTLVDCPQNCSAKIPRILLADHCNATCDMKIMNCPFETIGCVETLPRYLLDKHLQDFYNSHLVFCMRTIVEQKKIISSQQTHITELTAALAATQAEMIATTGTLTKKVNELEKSLKKEEKEINSLQSDFKKMGGNLNDVQKNIGKIEKFLNEK